MPISFEDFLTSLAVGQLKTTHATDDELTGEIRDDYREVLLSLTNQGLTDITTKKKLFSRSATLTLDKSVNTYTMDTVTFPNLIQINNVVFPDGLRKTPNAGLAIILPQYNELKFSQDILDKYTSCEVLYQDKHPAITEADSINLPPTLLETLALYVAGLYISQMGGKENTGKGDQYYGLYIQRMREDQLNNSSSTSELVDEDTRFHDRGFV